MAGFRSTRARDRSGYPAAQRGVAAKGPARRTYMLLQQQR
jgi:hypothetical protein